MTDTIVGLLGQVAERLRDHPSAPNGRATLAAWRAILGPRFDPDALGQPRALGQEADISCADTVDEARRDDRRDAVWVVLGATNSAPDAAAVTGAPMVQRQSVEIDLVCCVRGSDWVSERLAAAAGIEARDRQAALQLAVERFVARVQWALLGWTPTGVQEPLSHVRGRNLPPGEDSLWRSETFRTSRFLTSEPGA